MLTNNLTSRLSRLLVHSNNPGEEPVGWESRTGVCLDWFNSDLNLLIDTSGCIARPLTEEGFKFMWAGARANYGIQKEKAFFEVRLTEYVKVSMGPGNGFPNEVRIGWSVDSGDFSLGEGLNSYAYGSSAHKLSSSEVEDYGIKFLEGDVIGAYCEATNDEFVLSFTINGKYQGECFRIHKTSSNKAGLFPHIYVKNVAIQLNFGGTTSSEYWFPPLDASWTLIGGLSTYQRVSGLRPPNDLKDCEILMMCGLPGCGKSYWADQHNKANPKKRFTVLGTNSIMEKMKIIHSGYATRWEVLIHKATWCLNELIRIASTRRRNYILDQTNVYASAQQRKMLPFKGFHRKAVVVIPTDEEFRRRINHRLQEEDIKIPEDAIDEMKDHFELPKKGYCFDEVIFTELNLHEAVKLVRLYHRDVKSSHRNDDDINEYERNGRDRNSRNSINVPGGRRIDNEFSSYKDDWCDKVYDQFGFRGGSRFDDEDFSSGGSSFHDRGGSRRGCRIEDRGGSRRGCRIEDRGGSRKGCRIEDRGGSRGECRIEDRGGSRRGSRIEDRGGSRRASGFHDRGVSRRGSGFHDRAGSRGGSRIDYEEWSGFHDRAGSRGGSRIEDRGGSRGWSRIEDKAGSRGGSRIEDRGGSRRGSGFHDRAGSRGGSRIDYEEWSGFHDRAGSRGGSRIDYEEGSGFHDRAGSRGGSRIDYEEGSGFHDRAGSRGGSRIDYEEGSGFHDRAGSRGGSRIDDEIIFKEDYREEFENKDEFRRQPSGNRANDYQPINKGQPSDFYGAKQLPTKTGLTEQPYNESGLLKHHYACSGPNQSVNTDDQQTETVIGPPQQTYIYCGPRQQVCSHKIPEK